MVIVAVIIGYTYGGDVGVDYFAHYDNDKRMDSLIIDVFCLFTDYTLKHVPRKVKMSEKKMSAYEAKNFSKKIIVEYLDDPYSNSE